MPAAADLGAPGRHRDHEAEGGADPAEQDRPLQGAAAQGAAREDTGVHPGCVLFLFFCKLWRYSLTFGSTRQRFYVHCASSTYCSNIRQFSGLNNLTTLYV